MSGREGRPDGGGKGRSGGNPRIFRDCPEDAGLSCVEDGAFLTLDGAQEASANERLAANTTSRTWRQNFWVGLNFGDGQSIWFKYDIR